MFAALIFRTGLACGLAAAGLLAAPALADHQPGVIVHNGRGIPPLINGVDATGAVVEGDWGLYRPGAGQVSIYPDGALISAARSGHYFPATGRRPRYGRDERLNTPYRRPRPAEPYHRNWTSESPNVPATTYPGYEVPAVVVERGRGFSRQSRRQQPRR